MRIDKFVWCVRLFKTRSLATAACNKDQIRINGESVKPSKSLTLKDQIAIKHGPYWREYKVLDFPKSRIGAKLVELYLLETTDDEVLQNLEDIQRMNRQNQILGIKGRPTKKDRRDLDKRRNNY